MIVGLGSLRRGARRVLAVYGFLFIYGIFIVHFREIRKLKESTNMYLCRKERDGEGVCGVEGVDSIPIAVLGT
jgi:hypothetical protein